jgi:hypothetical protein
VLSVGQGRTVRLGGVGGHHGQVGHAPCDDYRLPPSVHRRLKDALKARLAGPDWPLHLPWVLLGLRAAPREDSGVSAAELVYGKF